MTNGQIYTRFTIMTAVIMIVVVVISYLLDALFDIDAGAGAGVVSLMMPAMDAGMTYVRKTRETLDKKRMWRLSVVFFVINFAIGVVVYLGIILSSDASLTDMLAQVGPITVLIILLVIAAVFIPIARYFLGYGGRLIMKQLEKGGPS